MEVLCESFLITSVVLDSFSSSALHMTNVLEPVLPLKPTVILQNYSIFLIKVYLTYNIKLVLGVQQSDSLIHTYIYIYIYIYIYNIYVIFHYRSLQDTDCNSLCYPVNPVAYLFYIQ